MRATTAAPRLRRRFLQAASILAIGAGVQSAITHAANAQPAPAAAAAPIEEIVVTGSRVVRSGFETPTPVTAVTSEDLLANSPGTVADALTSLPSIQGSQLPTNTGVGTVTNAGASQLNLRGLGIQRTLTLLDGRRFVPFAANGAPDVSVFPSELLARVEIVTGGASAAYGSDAVSGVVNFILDKKFDGVKGSVEGGISRYGDDKNYKAAAAFGTGFANDRGHLVASAEYYHNDGLNGYGDRAWAKTRYAVITLPANLQPPKQANVAPVGFSIANYGGLITAGPLKGTTFGPGGVPKTYNYGSITTTTSQVGGDGVETSDTNDLITSLDRKNLFAHLTYDISDDVTAYVEAMWSQSIAHYNGSDNQDTQTRQFTIFNDNAFIPAALAAQMTALKVTSFTLGRISRDWGFITIENNNKTPRFVAGFDGRFGDGWTYGGYYTHGENARLLATRNNQIVENAYRAVDAVRNTAGQIVCRSTLTTPSDGCVPINLFGEGSPSAAAIDYVTGDSIANQKVKQDAFAFNIAGEPFTTWAGPVSIATGIEYHAESTVQTVDPISAKIKTCAGIPRGCPAAIEGTPGGFQTTNPQAIAGSTNVKEGYFETVVPLARDAAFAKSLELNGAVRYADYKYSGGVVPWKIGGTYTPISDIRIRATKSRDIRAANLSELFQASSQSSQTILRDPFQNGQTQSTFNYTSGNTKLKPESADTNTIGVVFQPSFLKGFRASVDYFDITIDGAIGTLQPQDVADGCGKGDQTLCALIGFTPQHTLATITTPFQNTDVLKTNGVDIEADYVAEEVFDGRLTLRTLFTYLGSYLSKAGFATTIESAGASGRPHWRATFRESYDRGPFTFFLQEKYIGGAVQNNAYVEGVDISAADNHLPSKIYTDLTLRYKFENIAQGLEVYATCSNLFDVAPPINSHTLGTSGINLTSADYDTVGRAFKVGMQFKY